MIERRHLECGEICEWHNGFVYCPKCENYEMDHEMVVLSWR